MILVYDGTFEGFLSLVYEVYYEKLKPIKIYKTLPNKMIFEEIKISQKIWDFHKIGILIYSTCFF